MVMSFNNSLDSKSREPEPEDRQTINNSNEILPDNVYVGLENKQRKSLKETLENLSLKHAKKLKKDKD
jgi:hypothetical protein